MNVLRHHHYRYLLMIFCFIYRHRLKSITFALNYYHRNQIICGENKKNLSQLVTLKCSFIGIIMHILQNILFHRMCSHYQGRGCWKPLLISSLFLWQSYFLLICPFQCHIFTNLIICLQACSGCEFIFKHFHLEVN